MVFRLNVDSCTVVLLDSDAAHTLAEARKDTILGESRDSTPDACHDGCPDTCDTDCHLLRSTSAPYAVRSAHDNQGTEAVTLCDRLSEPVATHGLALSEGCKFYAGVPIYGSEPTQIGVLYVKSAETPDSTSTTAALHCMQEISGIVTDYLVKTKSAAARAHGDRIVEGMSSFVEELSSVKYRLDEPSEDTGKTSVKDTEASIPQATDPQSGDEFESNDRSVSQDSHDAGHRHVSSDTEAARAERPAFKYETETSSEPQDNPSDDNVWQIFTRAAEILRKGFDAQGCVFLDVDTLLFTDDEPDGVDPASYESADDDPESGEHVQHDPVEEKLPVKEPQAPSDCTASTTPQSDDSKPVRYLGTATDAGFDSSELSVKREELKRCLLRYPCGAVFRFSSDKLISVDQSHFVQRITGGGLEVNGLQRPQPLRRISRSARYVPASILSQIKNIKWLVFLPLYSYAQRRWFAGTFIWSTKGTPIAPEDQMLYLKTFGSCIMTEVTGMEALNTNRSKSNFIASISHELRSPLHGILGSLEFLEDSVASAYQMSLISSIQTCGRTLLDTIDHLLDYAKINNLNKTVAERSASRELATLATDEESDDEHSTLHTTEFDLALLLEEVVEAVFTGQTFRKARVRGTNAVNETANAIDNARFDDSKSTEDQIHEGSAKFSGRVFIIMDISPARSWVMKGQPGALRRIFMNVFGNAIKYCSKGTIELSLRLSRRDEERELDIVEVIIRDSGRGMSNGFLQKHLFKPFAQEDSFVPGAGLGLSITKQIVDHLGGKIVVRSEKDVGTEVAMYLPLELNQNPGGPEDEVMQMAREAAKDKTICLLNPTDLGRRPGEQQFSRLSMSFATMCRNWFGLKFIESSSIAVKADVFMYAEPPPIEYLLKHHSERRDAGLGEKEAALLIICTNAFEAASLRAAGITHLSSLGRVIEVVNQPVGIRKFAKVLLQSLQAVEAAQKNERSSSRSQAAQRGLSPDSKTTLRAPSEARSLEHRPKSMQDVSRAAVYNMADDLMSRPAVSKFQWKSDQDIPTSASPGVHTENSSRSVDCHSPEPSTAGTMSPLLLSTQTSNDGLAPAQGVPKNLPSVLVVDDNAINLKLLVTFMKKLKLPYVEATNGLEALEKFKSAKEPFKFVLMDLQMPVMDGMESTRKIRTHEHDQDCRAPSMIIAITGVGSEETKKEAMDSGMSRYLTKPVSFKVLKDILEKHDVP